MSGRPYLYPQLWAGCIGLWSPQHQRFPSSTLMDYSGATNHGALTNMDAATDWVPSKGVMSLDFDGTNDDVTISRPLTGMLDATMSAWIYVRTAANSKRVIDQDFSAGFYMGQSTGTVIGGGFRCGSSPFGSFGAFTVNTWFHCSVTRVGAVSQCYINGSADGISAYTNTAASVGGSTLRIGSNAANYSDMQVAEVVIHNRALSGDEIRLLARRPGVMHERFAKRHRVGSAAPAATNTSNLLLLGVG